MERSKPKATVILPSMSAARAAQALESLAAQTVPHETIVVDNGSPGGEVAEASAAFEFTEAIRNDSNLGFSRAVNLGARAGTAPTLVIVNDDARYDPGFVERLVAAVEPARGVTMAAGVLRWAQDPKLIDTAGIEIDRTLLGLDYLNGEPLDILATDPPDPFGPSGGAAAYDREAFAAMGGFDEAIFAYFEDLDLALRMRLAGMTCRLAPDARGTHHHSATLGAGTARKDYLMGFARGYLLRKWGVVSPQRAPGVALRELVICTGQAIRDRNAQGVRGRRQGWIRAAGSGTFPERLVADHATLTMAQSLRRRARRRAAARRAR